MVGGWVEGARWADAVTTCTTVDAQQAAQQLRVAELAITRRKAGREGGGARGGVRWGVARVRGCGLCEWMRQLRHRRQHSRFVDPQHPPHLRTHSTA